MKKKRILSWLLAIAIVISSLPISALLPTAVSADENIDDVEAILLVNSLTEQVIEPIDLTVPYTTFSDLGLTVTNDDPGFVTSLHVLAQYYIQEKGATAATINDYIDVNADGTVNTIEAITALIPMKMKMHDGLVKPVQFHPILRKREQLMQFIFTESIMLK